MRSSDYSSQSPQQIFESVAATLAAAIVRMHARGMLDQPDPDADLPEKPGENGQDCLELSD
jgi:hypothetical protein